MKSHILILAILVGCAYSKIEKVLYLNNFGNFGHGAASAPIRNILTSLKNQHNFLLDEGTGTSRAKLLQLSDYDVVIFANFSQNGASTSEERTAIENFFNNGGKAIGMHASSDHRGYWSWWSNLHNTASFNGHGNSAFSLRRDPEIDNNPALAKMWEVNSLNPSTSISSTEIYEFGNRDRIRGGNGVTVLQTVAPSNQSYADHVFTWLKQVGNNGGEYLFTALGHSSADAQGGWLEKAMWAYMQYLTGEYGSGCTNPEADNYEENATSDDGSCVIPGGGEDTTVSIVDSSPFQIQLSQIGKQWAQVQVEQSGTHNIRIVDVQGNTVYQNTGAGKSEYKVSLAGGYYQVLLTVGENTFQQSFLMVR